MNRTVLIHEIMWEYNYTKAKAEGIVSMYERIGAYDLLCDRVKDKDAITVKKDV